MAKFTTLRCPVCNRPGELEVTEAQLLMLTAEDRVPAVLALHDRDKLIQDQADIGIHPACFLRKLERLGGDVSIYDGMGEIAATEV